MIKSLYTASANLHNKMKNMQITSNNLANINTTGYKREVPFSEVMARFDNQPGKQISDLSMGSLIQTGNPLDLAINGNAMFMVQTPGGVELTSNGRFSISEDGFLINDQGYKILGKGGEINIGALAAEKKKDIEITRSGEVKAGEEYIDTLLIASTDNRRDLFRASSQNFTDKNNRFDIADQDNFEIHQGYLEESNVSAVIEMQEMIQISKDYEATQKVIHGLDSILEKAKEIGRV